MKQIIASKTSKLGQINNEQWKKIQKLILKMLHKCIPFCSFSELSYIILLIIAHIQFLYFPFHLEFKDWIWKDTFILSGVQYLIKPFSIVPLLRYVSYDEHIIIFYFSIFLIWALIGEIALGVYLLKEGSQKRQLRILYSITSTQIRIFSTVLFFPILGIQISLLDCSFSLSDSVMTIHEEISCLSSSHIIHGLIGIVNFILTSVVAIVLNLIYFESSTLSNDQSSRINSHAEVFETVCKILMLLCFPLLKEGQNLLIATILLGSQAMLCFFYLKESRFYSSMIQKAWRCSTLLSTWSAFVMLILSFLGDFEKSAPGAIFYVIGIPIIILYGIYGFPEHYLMFEERKYINSHQSLIEINRFLTIIGKASIRKKNLSDRCQLRTFEMEIKGYAQMHSRECPNYDCPMKCFLQRFEGRISRILKDRFYGYTTFVEEHDDYSYLLHQANLIFLKCIDEFPSDNRLRLCYVLFLIEKYQILEMAISQYKTIEKKTLSLEDSFLYFRYREFIHERLLNTDRHSDDFSIKISRIFKFETHFQSLRSCTIKCAKTLLIFWNTLNRSIPKLNNLEYHGFQVNNLIKKAKHHWKRLNQISPDSLKGGVLYSFYLIAVLNDRKVGESIFKKIHEFGISTTGFKKGLGSELKDFSSYSDEGNPCVYISGLPKQEGVITECNLSFSRIFGYTKKEIIGSHMDILLPPLSQGFHENLIKKSIQTKENVLHQYHSKSERFIFCVDSNGYLFSVFYKIVSRPSVLNQNNFICIFHIDKQNNSSDTLLFIVNTKATICGISSSCLWHYGFRPKLIEECRLNLKNLCPQLNSKFLENLKNNRKGDLKSHILKCFFSNSSAISLLTENTNENSDTTPYQKLFHTNLKLYQAECKIFSIKFGESVGYRIIIKKKDHGIRKVLERIPYKNGFYFHLDPSSQKFMRDFIDSKKYPIILDNHQKSQPMFPHFEISEDRSPKFPHLSPKFNNSYLSSKMLKCEKPQNTNSIYSEKILPMPVESSSSFDTVKNILSLNMDDHDINDKLNSVSTPISIHPSNILENPPSTKSTFIKALFQKLSETKNYLEKYLTNSLSEETHKEHLIEIASKLQSKLNYGEGINCYRLNKGEFFSIKNDHQDCKITENELFLEESEKKKKNRQSQKKMEFLASNIKSRELLEASLLEGNQLLTLRIFVVLSFLLFLFSIIFAISEYFLVSNIFDYITQKITLIEDVYGRNTVLLQSLFYVRELLLLQEGVLTHFEEQGFTKIEYKQYCREELKVILEDFLQIQRNIAEETKLLEHSEIYLPYTTNRSFELFYHFGTIEDTMFFSFQESILQYSSTLLNIINDDDDALNKNSTEYLFILQNGFNGILYGAKEASTFYISDFEARTSEGDQIEIIIYSLSTAIIILFIAIWSFIIWDLENKRMKILCLFLQIPSRYLDQITDLCETFIEREEYGKDENLSDCISNEDENIIESFTDFTQYYAKRRKRGYQFKKKLVYKLWVKVLFLFLAFQGIFLTNFLLLKEVNYNYKDFIKGYENTLQLTNYIEYFLDDEFSILYDYPLNKSMEYIFKILEATILTEKKERWQLEIVGQEKMDKISFIQDDDICRRYNILDDMDKYWKSESDCDAFLDGTSTQGLSLIVPHFFQLSKAMLSIFSQFSEEELENQDTYSTFFNNESLINSFIILEGITIPMEKEVISLTKQGISSQYQNRKIRRLGLMAGFLITVVLFFGLVWNTYIRYINKTYYETIKLVSLIPIDMIFKVRKIHEFIEQKTIKLNL